MIFFNVKHRYSKIKQFGPILKFLSSVFQCIVCIDEFTKMEEVVFFSKLCFDIVLFTGATGDYYITCIKNFTNCSVYCSQV